MKNVYEVLRQKELEISQLEKQVDALRVVAPLISEDKQAEPTVTAASPPAGAQRVAAPVTTQVRPTGSEGFVKRWP